VISGAPAIGRIPGRNFNCEPAMPVGGIPAMRMPAHGTARPSSSIFLCANQTVGLAGRAASVAADSMDVLRIRLCWPDGRRNRTQDFHAGYELGSEFGELTKTGPWAKCI